LTGAFVNRKGQASFEMMFIMLIILVGAFLVTGFYFSEADEISAVSITRIGLAKAFQETSEFCTVGKIEVNVSGTDAAITVTPRPDVPECKGIDLQPIKEKIEISTGFESVTVTFS